MNRRHFVEKLGATSLYSALMIQHQNKIKSFLNPEKSSDYWRAVKRNFPIANRSDNYLNLNSGSAGTMSATMIEGLEKLIAHMNENPPYEALNSWSPERSLIKEKISTLLDCGDDEISIIRNTTEGMNLLIGGVPMERGEEILCAVHDYPHCMFAVDQRAHRDGVSVNKIQVDLLQGDDHIVDTYTEAFTDKTRVLLLTYITHRQGYIMPVKRIVAEAKKRNILVILDAAHAVGQIKHSIRDLGVDYYASSLHKWLNAPHSTGLLYVRKDRIKDLQPLMASDPRVADRMVKFEYIGTRTFHQEVGILMALEELDAMTLDKKEARLRELTTYWIQKAKNIPGLIPISSFDTDKYCAVWTFAIKGVGVGKLRNALEKEHLIHTKTVGSKPIGGIRISTNIYHLESDLDRFVSVLSELSNKLRN